MDFQKDRGCFVCGPDNAQGMHADFMIDEQQQAAFCEMELGPPYQGWQGVVHGGIISTLLDEAGIYACRTQGETFVTAELNVRFRKPVPVGRKVRVSAQVRDRRRSIFKVVSQLTVEGEIYAEAE
ncbi:MAG TPA: PaaI family thioesterase, partial [Geoalkalibacter subterraneus]|nr:PaaI family thioesterase [Geoalkalibacter subterraneus]